MVSVLALSAVDHRFESISGQIKDYKIGICCFSCMQHLEERTKTDWLGIRIMCPSVETCLSAGTIKSN